MIKSLHLGDKSLRKEVEAAPGEKGGECGTGADAREALNAYSSRDNISLPPSHTLSPFKAKRREQTIEKRLAAMAATRGEIIDILRAEGSMPIASLVRRVRRDVNVVRPVVHQLEAEGIVTITRPDAVRVIVSLTIDDDDLKVLGRWTK